MIWPTAASDQKSGSILRCGYLGGSAPEPPGYLAKEILALVGIDTTYKAEAERLRNAIGHHDHRFRQCLLWCGGVDEWKSDGLDPRSAFRLAPAASRHRLLLPPFLFVTLYFLLLVRHYVAESGRILF